MITVRHGRRRLATMGFLVLLLGVAACGESEQKTEPERFASLSAENMVKTGIAAMGDVDTFRVRLQGDIDGPFNLTAVVDDQGRCRGQFSLGKIRVQVIHTANATYQKGGAEYWSQDAGPEDSELIEAVSGRWAKTPRIPQLARPCEFERLMDELLEFVQDSEFEDWVVRTALHCGSRVIKLTDPIESGFVYFSHAAPHRILALSAGENGRFDFSDFNEPVTIDVPGPDEFVELGDALNT